MAPPGDKSLVARKIMMMTRLRRLDEVSEIKENKAALVAIAPAAGWYDTEAKLAPFKCADAMNVGEKMARYAVGNIIHHSASIEMAVLARSRKRLIMFIIVSGGPWRDVSIDKPIYSMAWKRSIIFTAAILCRSAMLDAV